MNYASVGQTIVKLAGGSESSGANTLAIENIEQLDYFLNLHNLRLIPLDTPSDMSELSSLCLMVDEDSTAIIMSKQAENYSVYNCLTHKVEVVATSELQGSCFMVDKLDKNTQLKPISIMGLLSRDLLKVLVVSFCSSIFALFFPLFVILILVSSVEVKSLNNLFTFLTGGILFLAASYSLSRLKSQYIQVLNNKTHFLGQSFLLRVVFAQLAEDESAKNISFWQQLNAKSSSLQRSLIEHFVSFTNELMMLLLALVLFAYFSPSLFFIPMIYLVCCLAYVFFHNKKRQRLTTNKTAVKDETFLSQGNSLAALGLINPALHFFTKAKASEFNNRLHASLNHDSIHNGVYFLSMMCVVAVLSGAAAGSLNQTLSAMSFMASIILIWRIMASNQTVIALLPQLTQNRRDIELLNNALNEKTLHFSPLAQKEGTICSQQCSFRYPASKHNALTNINIEIPHQAKLAISGSPLCGKTTLLKLLAGQLHPIHGTVNLNSTPLIECQKSVLFMSSRFVQFDLTLKQLIDYSVEEKTNDDIVRIEECYELDSEKPFSEMDDLQKERYLLALAVLRHERIVLFDDILERHKPVLAEHYFSMFVSDCEQKTLVFSTQFRNLLSLTPSLCLLDKGTITAAGPTHKVLEQWHGGIK